MIRTVAGYAGERGRMDGWRINSILETVKAAIADGTYLAISPQFIVTATIQDVIVPAEGSVSAEAT
jgi:hypothetical protein